MYYSCIHSYLNYGNLVLGSTYVTNLKKLRNQQKHAIRTVHYKTKFEHTKELFKSANVLHLYKLKYIKHCCIYAYNSYKNISSCFHWKLPQDFSSLFYKMVNSELFKLKITITKYRISIRGPAIWNDFVEDCLKNIEKTPSFKVKTKSKLANFDDG